MKKRLLIIGAGGHGRSVAEAVTIAGNFELIGFIDDAAPSLPTVGGRPVLDITANITLCRSHADAAIVAIGNNTLREALSDKLVQAGFELASVIHPKAIVSPSAIIGTEAKLGHGVIVNCGAVVDHHAQVDDFGHLGVHACMAGGARLGRAAWLQAGVALGYNTHIPAGTVLTSAPAIKKF